MIDHDPDDLIHCDVIAALTTVSVRVSVELAARGAGGKLNWLH